MVQRSSENGIKYREFEVQQEAQREQFLENWRREGRILSLQLDLPKHRHCKSCFGILTPNSASTCLSICQCPVHCIQGAGGFISSGCSCSYESETGKLDFVGGMDILIRRFACGYVQGVKHINPGATVFQKMTGTHRSMERPCTWRWTRRACMMMVQILSMRPRTEQSRITSGCRGQ